jgi:hypothetical protein
MIYINNRSVLQAETKIHSNVHKIKKPQQKSHIRRVQCNNVYNNWEAELAALPCMIKFG